MPDAASESETTTTVESPWLGTITIERRYSLSHNGWFWNVTAKNPWPAVMFDGRPSVLDSTLRAHGFQRRHAAMERGIRKVVRRWESNYQRATKELAKR